MFRVTEIKVPPLDPESADAKRIDEALRTRRSPKTCSRQYVARLENEIGVTINQTALNQVTGGSTAQLSAAMQIEPPADAFAARYARGEAQVVWTTLVADLETPVSAFLKIAGGRPMSFLLESVEGGAVRGRYSIIGLEPDLIWRANGAQRRDQPRGAQQARRLRACPQPPLEALRALIAESRIDAARRAAADGGRRVRLSRLRHGAADGGAARAQSRPDRHSRRDPDPPDAHRRVRRGEGHDHGRHAGAAASRASTAKAALARARASGCRRWSTRSTGRSTRRPRDIDAGPLDVPAELQHHAGRIPRRWCSRRRSTSLAGDIFQVVLSQRFEAPFTLPPFALYRALRRVNPAPFLYFLDFGGFAVAGSSPEILVRVRDGKVTIRPIAGTRPRGATPHEDKALEEELLADPKERAEHLMLLDLGRNDVGRVAEDRHA